ncbi:MAG: nucleotide exchange factor GrpE, partial [Gemmatimonadetes bacterium]|nr:nucleotide exchange factor GrpE [Gemmatimonadota bacterium]
GQRWDLAQAELVGRLLDPLDDLLRVTALEPESASVEAIVEGVEMVERKFLQVLEEAGVEIVDPLGEPFDPNTMEAMMRVPPESDDLEDTVERVFQRGYALRGHLVRPARVSVYKG